MKNFNLLKLLISILVMLGTVQLMGQGRISGIVTDEGGEPLLGANVIVVGATEGTITDIDGAFSFNTSQAFPLTLLVSFTGYNSQEIAIDAPNSNVNVTLSEGVLLGDDVVISASRKREKVQEAPASISVIGARKLESSPNPTDPTRNLINTPGVQIQQQSANRINISMRGGAGLFGTSVFPILDYRSLVGPGVGTFQSDQAGLSTLDLQRIEVVRGPGSALYGPGVTQGVVHFISKNPIDFPGTSIELVGGELSTYGGALRHAGVNSAKTFGYKINAMHRRGNEFILDPNDPDDALQIAKFVPSIGGVRGIFQPGVANGVVSSAATPELLIPLSELDDDGDGNPMANDWFNTSINATLEFRPQDDLSVTLAGGFNTASSVFYNEQGEGLSQNQEFWSQARIQKGGFFGQVFYVNNDGGTKDNPTFLYQTGNRTPVGRTQLEAQGQYNFDTPNFGNSNWTAGIDYRFSGQDTENLVYGRQEEDDDFSVIGGYLQGKFEVSKKVDLVVAGRYDRFNFIDDGAFAPRAAIVYKAAPNHTFRGSFNRANTTVSNLQLNIDFPLATVIPGSFDIWLYGNKNEQTFNNTAITWFNPVVPTGSPGLPFGVILGQEAAPGVTLNQALIAGITQNLSMNPQTAPLVPLIGGILGNMDLAALGFGGQLSPGFNVFDGTPLSNINAPISQISTQDTWEVGYKGLIGNKLGVTFDVFRLREDKNSQFTAISPAYLLTGIDGIAGGLGTAVQNAVQGQIEASLLGLGLDAATAAATAAGLGSAINGAYTAGGAQALNTPSAAFGGLSLTQLLNALPFHATSPTDQVPQDGVTHLAAGYRTFDPRTYWGADLGLEYYINDNFSIFGNYSWLSDVTFMQRVVDSDGEPFGQEIRTDLNVPKDKFRLGWTYTPEFGFRANMAFQHDDSYFSNSGQFSGNTDERNLVDAGVGYKFNNGVSIDLTATNVFDNEYRYLPNFPKIGRRILGKIRYDFGGAGPSDLDGDGIRDSKDACPTEAGTKAMMGCPDTDGDGIIDKDDKCPLDAGDALHMGCPDSDGDGVIDSEDQCPNVAGTLNGCPDSDGDGVADKDDNCPTAAGTLGGCPDSDGDGVADKDDNCPTVAGTVGGCPDGDGDGVADKDDKCPTVAARTADGCPADSDGDGVVGAADLCPNEGGIVDANGCPKDTDGDGIVDNDDKCPTVGGNVGPDGCLKPVPAAATEVFTRALTGVQFQTGRATLTRSSYGIMDEVVAIMAEYPNLILTVEGHTDSSGDDDKNMQLSLSRAQSVMKYLTEKGVDATRMKAVGMGELAPIADNTTAAGRAQNRRVAFRASF